MTPYRVVLVVVWSGLLGYTAATGRSVGSGFAGLCLGINLYILLRESK